MAEYGAEPAIIADAFQSRPDWTPQQVRERWDYDQRRIRASDGKLYEGVFFHALRRGELAPPHDRPLNPADYADDPGVLLGSQPPPGPDAPESIGDHARRILPRDASTADWVFIQSQLVRHVSDEAALAALAARRSAGRR
jgi:hypothetical protein